MVLQEFGYVVKLAEWHARPWLHQTDLTHVSPAIVRPQGAYSTPWVNVSGVLFGWQVSESVVEWHHGTCDQPTIFRANAVSAVPPHCHWRSLVSKVVAAPWPMGVVLVLLGLWTSPTCRSRPPSQRTLQPSRVCPHLHCEMRR